MIAQDSNKLQEFAIERLDAATDWIVKFGIYFLSNHSQRDLFDKLIQDWPVQMWSAPIIEELGVYALFRIKTRGVHYEIQSVYRLELPEINYEYWIVHISSEKWARYTHECRFYLTESLPRKKNGILRSSNKYFRSFKTISGFDFVLPDDNLNVLRKLRAWDYPNCFQETGLSKFEVSIDASGNLFKRMLK